MRTSESPAYEPLTVSIVVLPRFPFLSLAICTESLRVANRELGRQAFTRQILTLDGGAALSSSGIQVAADTALGNVSFSPVALILSSYRPEEVACDPLLAWLRRQDRGGALLGCVDTGAYLLAKAGMLRGRHIAAHHETLPAYEELFGDAVLLDRLSALEGRIASSAGGMATMDMMLQVLGRLHGRELADRVAHVLNYAPFEAGQVGPGVQGDHAIARVDRRLGRMVEIMHANLETPLTLRRICEIAQVEVSTARRVFLRRFKETPGRYYMKLRLARAQSLLTNSALPVGQIATMVGFADASAFSRAYRGRFGCQPSKGRRADTGA